MKDYLIFLKAIILLIFTTYSLDYIFLIDVNQLKGIFPHSFQI